MDNAHDLDTVAGLVEAVTFRNPENGFCVLRVRVPGQRRPVPVVGHAALVSPGESVQAAGVWEQDRIHGLQFRATLLEPAPPAGREAARKYLASGLIRGIGPVHAERLLAAFGEGVFDVIETHPDRLREVAGIGPARANAIVEGWREQRTVWDIMLFLHRHGIATSRAVQIFRLYGADAVARITENPYRLARDVRGIGFPAVDRMALELGIAPTASARIRAAIHHCLGQAAQDGHTGLPTEDVVRAVGTLLGCPPATVEAAVSEALSGGEVAAGTADGRPCLFLSEMAAAEAGIAERLRRLGRDLPPWAPILPEVEIPWLEKLSGLTLSDSQRQALAIALRSRGLVITGGPGVGKTTLVGMLVQVLRTRRTRIALCAPTGRAARRLADLTGLDAKTIHRLLEVDAERDGFRRGPERPLDCDVLVVDEVSMVDVPLMSALLAALPDHAALVLVGDIDQLPPVGPGQVLADVVAAGALPVVRLTDVLRQEEGGRIVRNAHRVNRGDLPELPAIGENSDFYLVEAAGADDAVRKIVEIVANRIPQRLGLDPVRDIQVLSPVNRGPWGAQRLNAALQTRLNGTDRPSVSRYGFTFAVGDKVMQVENDYEREVYNGEIGIIGHIDMVTSEMLVTFEDRVVIYSFGELDRIVPAYATTIHKAQGIEYPAVVVALSRQHEGLLHRNLLYTAVTRGRRFVVLVADRGAVERAVANVECRRRWSGLRDRLLGGPERGRTAAE